MNEREIFEHLLKIGKQSKDPEGVVAACLAREGNILVAYPSSDDSQYHAEFLVLEDAKTRGFQVLPSDILYTTLEPCSDFPGINDGRDCVTVILDASIKHIVYGAFDPEYSTKASDRFKAGGVTYRQTAEADIIERSAHLFNSTIRKDLSQFKLPRKDTV